MVSMSMFLNMILIVYCILFLIKMFLSTPVFQNLLLCSFGQRGIFLLNARKEQNSYVHVL